MSSISFQGGDRTSNGIPIYSPFVTEVKKGFLSTLFVRRTAEVCESLTRTPLDRLKVHCVSSSYIKLCDSSMGCVFPGVSLLTGLYKSIASSSIKTGFLYTEKWEKTRFHSFWVESRVQIGFPYHLILKNAQKISSRYRLNQKINQIFREIHIGMTRSEYSHENSSPPMFFLGQSIYGNLPLRIYYYPWHSLTRAPSYFKMNCYGFVCEVVLSTHLKAGEELKTKMQELSDKQGIPVSFDGTPCPFNLAAIFKHPDLNYWMRIQKLDEIEPGDIMVYLPPNHDASLPSDGVKPTGTHVMFVHSKEKKEGEGIQLSIVDSTRKAHCKEDSRFPKRSGIGKAPLTLIPRDKEQGIYVLQWGSNKKQQVKEVVVGRMVKKQNITV